MAKKRLALRAAIAQVPRQLEDQMKLALDEYAARVVSEAQAHAPVRKVFKAEFGRRKTKKATGYLANPDAVGKGRRILVQRRTAINRRGSSGELVLGRITHRRGRRAADPGTFKAAKGLDASRFLTQIGTVGKTSRPKYGQGYSLGETFQPLLTSRARYNLARGIGVHEIGGGSSSKQAAGSLVIGGALRDSIHAEDVEENGQGLEVSITASVRYARYVEYGTYKDYAQPFLRPAIHNSKRYLPAILKKHITAAGLKPRG